MDLSHKRSSVYIQFFTPRRKNTMYFILTGNKDCALFVPQHLLGQFFLIAEILHYLHPCAHGLIVFLFFYAALLLLAVHYHHRLLMGGICEVNCRMKHGTFRLQVRMSSRTTRYRENWSLIIKTFPHSTAGGQIFHRVINEEILKKWQLGSN